MMHAQALWKLDEAGQARPLTDDDEWVDVIKDVRRVIAWDRVTKDGEKVEVSTIFTGIDYGFGALDKPLLWETMVFGGTHHQYQQRYTSKEEAMEGHARITDIVGPLPPVEGSYPWTRGEKIQVTVRGDTRKGAIALISGNGRSLIVLRETHIPDLFEPLMVSQEDDGRYVTVGHNEPIVIAPCAESLQ
jgi:hypothetical protein